MDLYKLKSFRAAAICLNFNRAAQRLNCAQSTISAQIRALEEELGTPLFKRVKKRVELTAAGEKMLGYAEKLLAMEQEALADIAGNTTPSGSLSLMVPEALALTLLPRVIGRFQSRFPSMGLNISNCSDGGLEQDLLIEAVDLAFIFSDRISSDALDWEKLCTRRLCLAAAPTHPLAGLHDFSAGNLKTQTIFLPKAGCGYGLRFRQMLFSGIVRPGAVMEMTSIEAIKTCVAEGAGIAVLPEDTMAREMAEGSLIRLNWSETLEGDVLMVWRRNRRMTAPLDFLMFLFREIASEDDQRKSGHRMKNQFSPSPVAQRVLK